MLNPLLLPTPSAILDEYILLIQSGELFGHLQISTLRALAGFALGGSLGLLAGIWVGFSYRTEQLIVSDDSNV